MRRLYSGEIYDALEDGLKLQVNSSIFQPKEGFFSVIIFESIDFIDIFLFLPDCLR